MIAKDEDALMCDFMEFYHIGDWRAFPIKTSAALAFHLPPESRIKRILSGRTWSMDTILLAAIADRIGQLVWMLSEDGAKGRNRPDSLVKMLSGDGTNEKHAGNSLQTFTSGEDFAARWRTITERRETSNA